MIVYMLSFLITSIVLPSPYWYDSRIHNFGNVGLGGVVHAAVAPITEKAIDAIAYDGKDVRKALLDYIPEDQSVVDFGCGTGKSTRSLGIDTSGAMLFVAKKRFSEKKFVFGNAETFGKENEFDAVTISYLLHEVPAHGRVKILSNALRVARRSVYVMDISPSYMPSELMKTGEPYIENYLQNIESEIADAALRSSGFVVESFANNRVILYHLVV